MVTTTWVYSYKTSICQLYIRLYEYIDTNTINKGKRDEIRKEFN